MPREWYGNNLSTMGNIKGVCGTVCGENIGNGYRHGLMTYNTLVNSTGSNFNDRSFTGSTMDY